MASASSPPGQNPHFSELEFGLVNVNFMIECDTFFMGREYYRRQNYLQLKLLLFIRYARIFISFCSDLLAIRRISVESYFTFTVDLEFDKI